MSFDLGAAIASLVSGLGGATIGAVAVWRSQTRAVLMRERSIAHAILLDLDRIERLVPAPSAPARFIEGEPVLPAVHPWVEPLIVELSARDPRIVARLMSLDDVLYRLAIAINRAEFHAGDVLRAEREAGILERQLEIASEHASEAMHTSLANKRANVAQAIDRRVAREQTIIDTAAEVTDLFRDLRARLLMIATAPIPQSPFQFEDVG